MWTWAAWALGIAWLGLGAACGDDGSTVPDPLEGGVGAADGGASPGPDAGPSRTDAGPVETDAGPMAPRMVSPCETGTCWDASAPLDRCGMAAIDENYMTARYNVHSYATTLHAGTETVITVTRTAGMFGPAILVTDDADATISDGERGLYEGPVTATVEQDGRAGGEARVRIASSTEVAATVHVTAWTVVDEGFGSFLGTDVTYELRLASQCPSS